MELFPKKVGRVEVEFLVNSGSGFGFGLGLLQMMALAGVPLAWTLSAAGALVGYITNWIAIKLLFELADPVDTYGLFQVQGLFESRQIEVSHENWSLYGTKRIESLQLIADLGGWRCIDAILTAKSARYYEPCLQACVHSIQHIANHPNEYREIHRYLQQHLDIENTLVARLKLLSPTEFEDLLHPVFRKTKLHSLPRAVFKSSSRYAADPIGLGSDPLLPFSAVWPSVLSFMGIKKTKNFKMYPYRHKHDRPCDDDKPSCVFKPLEEEHWYREHYYREQER